MSNSKYKNEVLRLTEMLESTFEEIQYYKRRETEREKEMEILNDQCEKLKNMNETLSKHTLTKSKQKMSKSESTVVELEQIIKAIKKKHEDLQKRNAALSHELEKKEKEILALSREKKNVSLSRFMNDSNQTNFVEEELKERIKTLEETINKSVQERESIEQCLKREKEKSQSEVASLEKEKQKLFMANKQTQEERKSLQNTIKGKDETINEFCEKIKNINRSLNELTETWGIEDTQRLLLKVKEKLKKQNEQIKILKQEESQRLTRGNKISQNMFHLQSSISEQQQESQKQNEITKRLFEKLKIQQGMFEDISLDEKWMRIFTKIDENGESIRKERKQMQEIENAWWEKERKLMEQVENLKQQNQKCVQKMQKRQKSQFQVDEQSLKRKSVQNKNKILNEEMEELRKNMLSKEEEIKSLQMNCLNLRNELKFQKSFCDKELQKASNLELQLKTTKEEMSIYVEENKILKVEMKEVQHKLTEQEMVNEYEIKQMKENMFVLRSDLEHKESLLKQETSRNKAFKQQMKSMMQETEEKQKKFIDKKRIQYYRNWMKAILKKISLLKNQWEDWKNKVIEQKISFNLKLNSEKEKIVKLIEEYAKKHRKEHEKFVISQNIEELKHNIINRQLQQKIKLLDEKLQETNEKNLLLKLQIKNKEYENKQVVQKLKQNQTELTRLNNQISAFSDELGKQKKESAEKQKSIDSLQVKIQSFKKQLHWSEDDETKRKNDKIEALKKELIQRIKECVELQDVIKQKKVEISEIKKELSEKEENERIWRQKYEDLRTESKEYESVQGRTVQPFEIINEQSLSWKNKQITAKQKQFISDLQNQLSETIMKLKAVQKQLEEKTKQVKILAENKLPKRHHLVISKPESLSISAIVQEEKHSRLKIGQLCRNSLLNEKRREIESLYYNQDLREKQRQQSYHRRQKYNNEKEEQLLNELKITEQYKEIIQAENQNLKKEIVRKDKICNKFRQMETNLRICEKQVCKMQGELRAKEVSLMKSEKEVRGKIQEMGKVNKILESVNEELALERKRTKNFQQLYQKYQKKNKFIS